MAVIVNTADLPQLLNRLEEFLPQSLKMCADLKSLLSGKWPGLEFIVDQWPDFKLVITKFNPTKTKMCADLKSLLSGKWPGLEFIVDQWPDFKLVITKFNPTKTKCQYMHSWISIFCRDETALKIMLEQSSVFDWSKEIIFDGVDQSLLDIITETGSRFGLRVCMRQVAQMLQVTPDSLIVEPVPDHMRIKPLESTEEIVETIAANWPYSRPGVQEFITLLLDTFPSRCLVDEEDNLIGYALGESWMMGMLFVNSEYRRKGYGKLIMSHLANVYVTEGQSPVVCIVLHNPASVKMHEQIGFKVIPEFLPSWLIMAPV